jgi:hypothetical protein
MRTLLVPALIALAAGGPALAVADLPRAASSERLTRLIMAHDALTRHPLGIERVVGKYVLEAVPERREGAADPRAPRPGANGRL